MYEHFLSVSDTSYVEANEIKEILDLLSKTHAPYMTDMHPEYQENINKIFQYIAKNITG